MTFPISEIYYLVSARNKIVMLDAYVTLEFNKIQESLLEFCKTEKAKELVSSLKMSNNKEHLQKELNELDEMMNLVSRFGPLPISSSVHIIKLI